jgi:hypothetical protein
MTVARSVADVLTDHVVFEVECIDRMYLNVYQPRLQHTAGAAAFFRHHRGHQFASSALMGPMTEAFVAGIHEFIDEHGLDLVHFAKGQRKDDVTQQFLAGHDGSEEVLFVGRAQEKATVTRTGRRRDRVTGTSYAWLVKATALVNHFYFYCVDADFGPSSSSSVAIFPTTPSSASAAMSGQAASDQVRDRLHRPGQRLRHHRWSRRGRPGAGDL